ncbi:MAG TPA: UDP-N-acetylmuramate dehydrogenase [Actinomycetaceae bacterium]|nr:UDP-N-acetylmuramate dehydrogenase [Actinomycetaceae bacterium]
MIPEPANGPPVSPVLGLAHPDPVVGTPTFAEMTTFRAGGEIATYVEATSEKELIDVVRAADHDGVPLLVLGGGSNILASDERFEGVVVRDMRRELDSVADSTCSGASITAPAGQPWDDLVAFSVQEEWMGLESLSGIPGTVGASPIQNVGAYGQEVAEALSWVRVFDRLEKRTRFFARSELELSYRDSRLKRSLRDAETGGGRVWGPTGRWVVLECNYQLRLASLSAPVRYAELARTLDVPMETRVPSRELREAVLGLRRGKGMVLDPADHDTWSAGSFFTNPILPADAELPAGAPRFPVTDHTRIRQIGGAPVLVADLVKTSAAWLIAHSGFEKGHGLPGPAALSTRHVLALTNRGGATASEIWALAEEVRAGVKDAFGIELVPEPVVLGR